MLSRSLAEVQARRNLYVQDSNTLAERQWSSPATKQSLRDYIEAREMLLRQRDAAGLGLLSSATHFDPDNAAAWRMLALYWEGIGRMDYAREAWHQVGRINPMDLEAQYFLGLESSKNGDVENAAAMLLSWRLGQGDELLVQSMRPRPDKVMRAEAVLAESLYRLKESAAAEAMRQSLRNDMADLIHGRARFQISQDKWLDLISLFQSDGAQRSAFDAVLVFFNLPVVDIQTRKTLLNLAIGIAILFDDGSEISAVINQIPDEMILALAPNRTSESARADLLFEVATLFSNLGNQDGAAWLYEDVLEIDPTNVMARNNLGYYELEQGRMDPAVLRLLETAWRDAPEHPAILDSYGWLQYLQGRYEDDEDAPGAISLLKEAHTRSGEFPSAEILDHLGDAYYRSGNTDAAREAWNQALSILEDPTERQAHMLQSLELQKMVWGRRIRDAGAVYDLNFGPMQVNIEAKLAALDAGEPCPVYPLATEAGE
ncbi:MAG: tetratricopeptide repeat protein [Planctomycetota bacterium]|nr:tetratricopeptide repeat protein [Planctomycetota bacterium]